MQNHDHDHEFRLAIVSDDLEPLEPLVTFLRNQPLIGTVHTFGEDRLPADLSRYRGVFMYIHPTLQPGTADKLINYTQAGGRMIIPHHGIASSKTRNPDWLDFVGIRIAPRDAPDRPWRVVADTTHTFVDLCPEHYITSHGVVYSDKQLFSAGADAPETLLPALRFADTEVFVNQQHMTGRNKTILFGSHCIEPDSGHVICQPDTGWMEPIENGWIFYFQPGHRPQDFQHPAYRQILLNCLTWDSRNSLG